MNFKAFELLVLVVNVVSQFFEFALELPQDVIFLTSETPLVPPCHLTHCVRSSSETQNK